VAKIILLIGSFDTKGEDYAFVRERILARGHGLLTLDTGVLGETDLFPVDIEAAAVAAAGGGDLAALREAHDRGEAMKVMCLGAEAVTTKLHAEGRFDAVLGLGGSGGASVIAPAMRALPVGLPKALVSTVASGDTSPYVGLADITMMPSVVDVAGVNRISETIYTAAAGAVCGMVETDYAASGGSKPIIAASMFGQTTPCVTRCRDALAAEGYEVLVFHGSGTGGRTMERMVEQGYVAGVLDITTTEWADELCGGAFSAGPDRLAAPGRAGIAHLIVPGCVDMVNFGPPETVPARYAGRTFYDSKPTVTLMRTTVEENARIGTIFADKANAAAGKVAFLLPLRGLSVLDSEGGAFWSPEADGALFDAIKANLRGDIPVVELDAHINDEAFSEKAVAMLRELMAE
jgi:uncharacterized protein (UPF0261 family)